MEEFLRWLGEQVGTALRVVVELLAGVFAGVDDFFTGLAESLGMSVTALNLVFLVVGVYLLYSGIRGLARRALLGGVIQLGLAVLLLGWLIN